MDRTVGDTFYIMFTTRAFATGIPTVLAGTPVVSAYEDNSLTQITAGITLGVDHDSVVGLNLLTMVATGANGYESGKDYNMVITTGTVGGVSVVGEVVGTFSLGRSAAAVDLANGTDGLGALKTLIDTIDDFLDTEVAAILVDTGTTLQAELDAIQAAVITNAAGVDIAADIIAIKSETASILTDTGTTLQAELDAIQAATITNAAGVDIAADIIALKAETALIVADTSELQTDDYPTSIAALQTDLNTLTDARSEPAQGAPGVNETTNTKVDWLYKAWRNKSTQTATTYSLFNDDTLTVDSKATVSDDATTATKGEVATGP